MHHHAELSSFCVRFCAVFASWHGPWTGHGGAEEEGRGHFLASTAIHVCCQNSLLSFFLFFFFKVKWHNRFVFTWYSASESTLQQQTSSITARLRSRFSTTDSSSAAFTKPVNWLNFLFQRFTHRILTWVHIWVSECLFSDYYHIK